MVTATWAVRERPILDAIVEEEETSPVVMMEKVHLRAGLEKAVFSRGLRALHDAAYVRGQPLFNYQGFEFALGPMHLTERGRREVGQWPGDAYAALVAELEARIAATADDQEKGRLRSLLDGVVGVGRDVAVDVLSKVVRDAAGIP